jgi:hypothetical protein
VSSEIFSPLYFEKIAFYFFFFTWQLEVETARPLVRSLQIHRYRDKDCGTAGLDASSKQIIFYHVFA